jgi:hypothetical protein
VEKGWKRGHRGGKGGGKGDITNKRVEKEWKREQSGKGDITNKPAVEKGT